MDVDIKENTDLTQTETLEEDLNMFEEKTKEYSHPKEEGVSVAGQSSGDTTKSKKNKDTTPVKKSVERKKKTKKEEDGEGIEPKAKGKRGRKRKEEALDNTGEVGEETKPKAKRAKNPKKSASSNLSNIQIPCPPPSPPPPTEAEVMEAAAKSVAESARKERLKLIPYYYEEMKEIFDYLCDRGVYWKNDLPKNKKYSNRDTKLLEKEVKRSVFEILEKYPKEKEVMEAFEKEEDNMRALEDQFTQGNNDINEGSMDVSSTEGDNAALD